MSELSRLEFDEIPDAQEIYNQAILYARSVGMIDWEFPFPESIIEEYWDRNELYCIRGEMEDVLAVVRLGYEPNPQIWKDDVDALYLGKMAVGHKLRGQSIASRLIIPASLEIATVKGLDEVRLDCLADNQRLRGFYQQYFSEKGEVEIVSTTNANIKLARFANAVK